MKAKLVTLLLALVMLVCMCAFTAEAADVSVAHCANGHTDHTGVDCALEIVTWEEWTGNSALPTDAGNYILTEDVTLTSAVTLSKAITLDLNGHNITRNVTSGTASRVLYITGNVVITDLSTDGDAGVISASVADGLTINTGIGANYGGITYVTGSLTLAGRAVLDGSNLSTTATTGGATVQMGSAKTFIMYGGTIKGMAKSGTSASALHSWGASVYNIYGGEISSVATEMAVYCGGNVTITGGKIVNGLLIGTGSSSTGVVSISGDAEITGTSNFKGFKTATISGAPTIQNVVIAAGEVVNFENLTGGSVGVTATGTFTPAGDAATYEAYLADGKIKSADTKALIIENNALATVAVAYCPLGHTSCDDSTCELGVVDWQYWYSTTSLPTSGNYILTKDVTLDAGVSSADTLMIDLNGHSITRNVAAAGDSWALSAPKNTTLVITDTSSGTPGTVSCTGTYTEGVMASGTSGAVLHGASSAGSYIILAGGVIDGSNLKTNHTTGATVGLNGQFTMYGGVIKGVQSQNNGSAIAAFSSTTITIHGGEIIGGAAKNGGSVYANGVFTMDGGYIHGGKATTSGDNLWVNSATKSVVTISGDAKIDGGVALDAFASFTVSGNAQILKQDGGSAYSVKIPEGKTITVDSLDANAKLGITATGVFTANGTAATFQSYINNDQVVSDDPAVDVFVSGSALKCGIAHCINGHKKHIGAAADCAEPIVEWKYWNAETAADYGYTGDDKGDYTTKMTGTGNWILTADLTLSAQRTTGNGTLRIDLNGHTITRYVDSTATTGNARAFYVYDQNTSDSITPALALTDLSTEGEAGSVKIAYAEGVTTAATGAIIYATNGPATVAGRAVIDNTGSSKVAIYATKDFTMYGGTLKQSGTPLYVESDSLTVKLLGGEIPGTVNLKKFGTAEISGDIQIGKLTVPAGKLITLGELGSNANIAINADGAFTEAGDAAVFQGYIDSGKITAATAGTPVYVKDDAIWMGISRCINGHTDHEGIDCTEEIVDWKYWNNESAKASYASWGGTYADGDYKIKIDGTGNWILVEDLQLNIVRTTGNGTLRIDLNGYDITRLIDEDGETARAFSVYDGNTSDSITPHMAITDLSTQGDAGVVSVKIEEGITPTFEYGVIVYVSTGSFKLAGRAILDASNISTTKTTGGAAVQLAGSKTFVMYGGEIRGLASTGTSSSAVNGWSSSVIQIHDGLITAGETKERAVYAGGEFTMDGGKVEGGVQIGTDADGTGVITLSGNAQITGEMLIKGCASVSLDGTASLEKLTFADTFTAENAATIKSTYAGNILLAWPEAVNYGATLGAPITVETDYAEAATIQVVGPNAKVLPTLYGNGVLYVPAFAQVTSAGETWLSSPDELREGYLKVYADTALTASGDFVVDTNGCDVTVTAPAGSKVTLYNSSNDEFDTTNLGRVTVTGGTVQTYVVNPTTGYRYIAVKNADGSYTAHRIHAKLKQVSIRPSSVGVYYSVEVTCDATLEALVANYGVAVSLTSMPDDSFLGTTPRSDILYTYISNNNGTFQSGNYHGALLTGIMTTGEIKAGDPSNEERAKMPVYANAYVVLAGENLDDDVLLMTDEANAGKKTTDADWNAETGIAMSLTEIMTKVNEEAKFNALTDTAKASVQNFYNTWRSAANWSFATIENWVKPSTEEE